MVQLEIVKSSLGTFFEVYRTVASSLHVSAECQVGRLGDGLIFKC
jgi:hypothetical protein